MQQEAAVLNRYYRAGAGICGSVKSGAAITSFHIVRECDPRRQDGPKFYQERMRRSMCFVSGVRTKPRSFEIIIKFRMIGKTSPDAKDTRCVAQPGQITGIVIWVGAVCDLRAVWIAIAVAIARGGIGVGVLILLQVTDPVTIIVTLCGLIQVAKYWSSQRSSMELAFWSSSPKTTCRGEVVFVVEPRPSAGLGAPQAQTVPSDCKAME